MSMTREVFGEVTLNAFGPLMVIRFLPGWTTDDLGSVMLRLLEIAPPRFGVISEILKVKPAGAIERKRIGEQLAGIESEVNERIVVSAVVTESMLTRGAIRAVRWLHPSRYPVLTFEHFGSGIEECIARLAREGVPLTPDEAREARILAKRIERDQRPLAQ